MNKKIEEKLKEIEKIISKLDILKEYKALEKELEEDEIIKDIIKSLNLDYDLELKKDLLDNPKYKRYIDLRKEINLIILKINQIFSRGINNECNKW